MVLLIRIHEHESVMVVLLFEVLFLLTVFGGRLFFKDSLRLYASVAPYLPRFVVYFPYYKLEEGLKLASS